MSYADIWVAKLETLLKEFTEEFDSQRKRLSTVDLELQDVLHELERVKFNVVEGYYYSKRIQELRLERRLIKTEIEQYQKLNAYLYANKCFELKRIKKGLLIKEKE